MAKEPRLNVALDEDTMAEFKELCRSQRIILSVAVRALVEKAIKDQKCTSYSQKGEAMAKERRLNVALDEDTMAKFKEFCRSQQLSLSVAVRVLIKRAIKEQKPFQIIIEDGSSRKIEESE